MLKKIIVAALIAGCGIAHAFAPQAGTWVVSSEADGKPGRGMAIDVQNSTMVMQMYAYESTGKPTFYLAVGNVVDDRVVAPLKNYQGGRYLGSGPRSGAEAGTAGNVAIRFTSGTTGFITFPNEAEKPISRFNFGYDTVPESLRGLWTLNSMGTDGLLPDLVDLTVNAGATANGNGLMVNAQNLFGCEHQVRGQIAGNVLCVKINSRGELLRTYVFAYSVNEGEGFSIASANGSSQVLTVRRLTTPQGVGTGIVLKNAEQKTANMSMLLQHIEQISYSGLLQ